MTKDDFIKLIDDNPELTTDGFGINTCFCKTEAEKESTLIESRKDLYSKPQEFQYCVDFLKANPHIESWKHSYNLKHDVERFIESKGKTTPWIPQGVFILAAIYMGYVIIRKPGDHGAKFSEYPMK
jgi:hypothetical protein